MIHVYIGIVFPSKNFMQDVKRFSVITRIFKYFINIL